MTNSLVRHFKAIKRIKLGRKQEGVIYKGEDGMYYSAIKSQEGEPQKPQESDKVFDDSKDENAQPSPEAKKTKAQQDQDQDDSKGEDSLWDDIIEDWGSEYDKQKESHDESEEMDALKRSKEITPPKEWMPKGITEEGEMDNDVSDQDAKQVAWEEQERKEKLKQSKNNHVGMKPGDYIAYPPPDEHEYGLLYADCSSTIDQMKDKLKFDAHPVSYRKRFIKQGSIMQDAIARVIPMSQVGFEVPNIYKRTIRKIETQDCYMTLLADLSGSMGSWIVKRAFTVVAEACGQWIPDERFAMYIFGTNFAKLKAFDEPYSKVRYRIGGLEQWRSYDGGGTVMHLPLKHILDYTKKVLPDQKQKVLIILSDWELSNSGHDNKTHELLDEFVSRKWIVINLAFGSLDLAKQYPGLAKRCATFTDLPNTFFEIYRLISYEGLTHKNFEYLFKKANMQEAMT